ncbi:right-handed parallel beta-helix repeat-containing protein [Cellulomonas shaoxiangyii]|uniref:Right-handed parallel beta-helix repeat-containing protein n=1 Tax=Cellulomonas shaoxiangyii TaxID=2566013 RepID=A0A4V1CMF4_9CELL|nr:right-handed parallel beta-helix repeat-containing protein [Cellulomonas shaoxiangyii]QCB92755.1 right-handed parallel beta-helix repeat-containing protein [Cellulomonas shaoxiangyii]TGY81521.1 right-handed parallel beta-helix repeat-containing protein [Cellulomonas shaoxiangyii]
MRVPSALPIATLAVAAALLAPPAHAVPVAAAPPPVPGCGATLTADARLTADLTCPAGNGLTLAAGVTLDLGGHVLRGAGGTGVVVPAAGDVTVRRGTITGWDVGVASPPTGWEEDHEGTVTVERVRFDGNGSAMDGTSRIAGPSKTFLVSGSVLTGNVTGFSATPGHVRFSRSTFEGNDSVVRIDSGYALIEDSRASGNGTVMSCYEAGCDLRGSTVEDNGTVATGYFMTAIEITDSTVRRNDTVVSNGGGYGYTRVERSRLSDNRLAVDAGDASVTVVDSTFTRNDVAFTAQPAFDESEVTRVVTGNRFRDGGDAILVEEAPVRLGSNDARRNSRWGIYAPNAVDLGGNTARGNGNEPQCVGVVCGGVHS